MSEEIKPNEITPKTKDETSKAKGVLNKIWTIVAGAIIGVASMLGVNKTQIDAIKNDANDEYKEVQNVVTAIQNKEYITAIDSAMKASEKLKTIAGEVKEATDTAKEGIEVYKLQIADLKTAAEAKDYKKVVAIASKIAEDITTAIPADKLTGKQKEIYDLIVQIIQDANAQKYDPIIDIITKISAIVKPAEAAPVAPQENPAEAK